MLLVAGYWMAELSRQFFLHKFQPLAMCFLAPVAEEIPEGFY